MRWQKLLIAAFVALLAGATLTHAGMLTSGLADAYAQVGEQEKLPVLVALSPQVDLNGVRDRWFRGRQVSFADQHLALKDTLEAAARQAFQTVQSSLQILERNGMIDEVKPLWLSNMFRVRATKAGAELIANFETVSEVGLDEIVLPIEPLSASRSETKLLATDEALKQIGAPQAWEKGTTGAGSMVGVIGAPVESGHSVWKNRSVGMDTVLMPAYCGDAASILLGCAIGVDRDKGDTVGVAPEAQWRLFPLACGKESRVSDVIQALQTALKGDYSDVPDVIVQAWEVGDSCTSALPEAAWGSFVNTEQLGTILIWAAGDHGDLGRGSIHLPAARPSESQTFFAIGNVNATGVPALDPRSSRGPSPCDRKSTKPDLSAPGVDVRSAGRDGFVRASGSLCAAGYVAGTCALMRQVNPDMTPSAAKIALQLSARDLGVTGEDNEFGFGLLDVAAAVDLAASSSRTGTVSGTIRYGGRSIPGSRVFLVSSSGSYIATTNAEGKFRFNQIPEGQSFALYVARFGFIDYVAPDSITVRQREERSVTVQLEHGIADDAEVDRGFILGVVGDDATAGVWTRAIPVPSKENGSVVQVGEDATAYGSFCFVTGNGAFPNEPAGAHDVDGGKTTLRSPVFRLDNLSDAKLSFAYAYSNDRGPQKGGDFFRVQISNDGGETWTNLIQTSVSTNGWQRVELKLKDFIESTDQMVLQFIAEDYAPPSLVEAAVDDIRIEGKQDAPEPPKNLSLTPSETGVQLTWNASAGASSYKVYMSGDQTHVFAPEHLFSTVKDTALFVPFDQIPYERFYFQVTAVK